LATGEGNGRAPRHPWSTVAPALGMAEVGRGTRGSDESNCQGSRRTRRSLLGNPDRVLGAGQAHVATRGWTHRRYVVVPHHMALTACPSTCSAETTAATARRARAASSP